MVCELWFQSLNRCEFEAQTYPSTAESSSGKIVLKGAIGQEFPLVVLRFSRQMDRI